MHIHSERVGTGPTILLTHGFAATGAMFAGNVPALAADHQVITWDLPGHGRSDSPVDPGEYTAEAVVNHMVGLLDEAGADRAVIAGHSVGGYLSLEFALAHPERLRGLALIDTGPGFRNDQTRNGWNRYAERSAVAFEERGLAAVGDSAELGGDVHRDAAGLAQAARGFLSQRDGHVMAGLPSITAPVLVVIGSEDAPFIKGSDHMARVIPDARLAVIEGAGHAPNITHAAKFDAVLRQWLDRLDGAASR